MVLITQRKIYLNDLNHYKYCPMLLLMPENVEDSLLEFVLKKAIRALLSTL